MRRRARVPVSPGCLGRLGMALSVAPRGPGVRLARIRPPAASIPLSSFRFLHTADIHLDGPLPGPDGHDRRMAERGSVRPPTPPSKTRRGFRRVPALREPRRREPDHPSSAAAGQCAGLLHPRRAETFALDHLGVALHGRSFPERSVTPRTLSPASGRQRSVAAILEGLPSVYPHHERVPFVARHEGDRSAGGAESPDRALPAFRAGEAESWGGRGHRRSGNLSRTRLSDPSGGRRPGAVQRRRNPDPYFPTRQPGTAGNHPEQAASETTAGR